MTKTIIFYPMLEKHLKKNKVKTAFIKNIRTRVKYIAGPDSSLVGKKHLFKRAIDRINSAGTVGSSISAAFTWANTPEGHNFWQNIALPIR